MKQYARVLVFIPIRLKASPLLDYAIPAAMAESLRPGVLVSVPLRSRLLPGVVLEIVPVPAVPSPRPIRKLLDPQPVLDEVRLALAREMARQTLAPLHKCVAAMLPPGLRPQVVQVVTPKVLSVPEGLSPEAATLLRRLLERGAVKTRYRLPGLAELKRRHFVTVERHVRMPGVRPKTVQKVRLCEPLPPREGALRGLKRLDVYHAVLDLLAAEGQPVPVAVVRAETGAEVRHLRTLERRGLLTFSREVVLRDPLSELIFTPDEAPPLLPDQQAAWEHLADDLSRADSSPILLLGVTGSGKTELYMKAVARVLAQERQALILVPEISLTPQMVRRFVVRFPGHVGLWHSQMSNGERYDTWLRVRRGEIRVLVGARSALFLPFPRLGLIVLDEEGDSSYKQDVTPRYHAREMAEVLAKLTGASLVLGSATPTLESYARALAGRYRLVEMPRRVMGHRRRLADWQQHLHLPANRYQPQGEQACTAPLPRIQVVDLRAELKAGNRAIFSRALQAAIDRALHRQEQVILFLNRRGTATYVFCRDCGWVARCPRCDVPLIFHGDRDALLCHHCGYRQKQVRTCPQCGSSRVRAFGLGTEGLERHVRARWPQARLLRWDRDVARSHAAHTALLGRFARGDADILIGTQMIAHGLDFPKVTVVGIVSADTGLFLPDFRAAERTFQLLTQVAGRAGRGILGGQVILQTYHPDHYVIRYAAQHDYVGFARYELRFREQTGYPPAIRLARLVYAHPRAEKARRAAEHLAQLLLQSLADAGLPATDLIGPAPAYFARVRGRFRWQLLLRSTDPARFLREFPLPAGWQLDIDPQSVL